MPKKKPFNRPTCALNGSRNGMWKGGRISDGNGYVQVLLTGSDPYYEMTNGANYVLEHRLVMARHIGRVLKSWECVHHKDGNKSNNAIENLELLAVMQHNSVSAMERLIRDLRGRVAYLEGELQREEKMSEKTSITWTDHTFNIAWGCTKVSPGCKNCYADTLAHRYSYDIWGPETQRRTFGEKHWREPLKWNSAGCVCVDCATPANRDCRCGQIGSIGKTRRARVFCSSMCDVFEDHPTIEAERKKLWPLIRATPLIDWQILTKRSHLLASQLPDDWGEGYPNVWLGVSVEDSNYLHRIDDLRSVPAKVRFVSYEPALGPIQNANLSGIHWLIYGGESGPSRRNEDKQWARDIMAICRGYGTAFFHKQSAGPRSGMGAELDGKIIQEFPQ